MRLSEAGRAIRQALATGGIVAVASCGPQNGPSIKPNDLIFAVDPDQLIEVEYKSSQVRIVAHRWTTSEPFVVTFERAPGRQFERCQADAALLASLRALTAIRARNAVSTDDAQRAARAPREWGTLRIREDAHREPVTLFIRPAPPPLARAFGSAATFEMDGASLNLLRQRCP